MNTSTVVGKWRGRIMLPSRREFFNLNKGMLSPFAVKIGIVVLCLLLWLACPRGAQSFIIINAPMTDTNAGGWVLGGNPTSAQLTGNGTIDSVGSGWLRLTNNQGNQTGFAYNTTTFDLSGGALIQFDDASWGGTGADGFSIFLFDANATPFNIGAFGGSLGYAQKLPPAVPSPVPGISGGYVGIGIDEFGNYSNPTEGRYLGPSAQPNTVAIRGTVNGFGNGAVGSTAATSSYPWIATSGNNGLLWTNTNACTPVGSGVNCRPSQTGTNYRKVIIQISPPDTNGYPTASVWVQFGYNATPTQMLSGIQLPQISSSQQLMVGFGASTGGSTNYHEVRNLMITTLGESTSIDLGITKIAVATGSTAPYTPLTNANVGTSFQYIVTATNNGPNNIYAPGVGVTDTFPAKVTAGTWSCSVVTAGSSTGGTTSCPTPSSGSGNINTAVNLTKGGSVAFRVNATVNSLPAGNSLSNTATLAVPGAVTDYYPGNNSVASTITSYAPLTVTKTFVPSTVPLNTASALTITLTNPNSVAVSNVVFTDNYISTNLKNSAAATNPQCGGTVTGASGASSLSLTGGTIPANGSCTVTVNVNSATAAAYTNTIAIGAVTAAATASGTSIGGNTAAASSTLTVLSPPTVTTSFGVTTMAAGDTTSLTVAINNPNSGAITLTGALTDNFPANMTIATGGNTGTCTGVTAAAGDNKFTMASGTSIPAGGCTIIVNVTSTATGTNTIGVGALQTSAGSNAAAASDSLTVHSSTTLTKAYSPATIAAGAAAILTLTITDGTGNPAQSGMAFTDTFPAELTVTAVGAVSGSGCSGATAFTPSTVTLTGGAIAGGNKNHGPCTFTATVQGNSGGTYINNNAQFSDQGGGVETSATTATLNVYAPPTVAKSFSPASITLGGTTVMTLTLSNPAANPGAVTTNKVTDTFPAGLTLKNPTFTFTPAACGTVTKISGATSAAGDNNLLFSAASLAAGASCQVQMNITSSTANYFTNTTGAPTATGPVALTGTPATAELNGTQAPTVNETFGTATIASGGNTGLTVTISNTNAAAVSLTNDFIDTFPTGMTIGTAGNTGTCAGVTATAGDNKFTMASGSSIPSGGCTIIVNVTSSTAGAAVNTIAAGALQSSVGNNAAAASATLKVYAPPTATKSFSAGISYGGSTTMMLILGNPAANVSAITTVRVDDNFPAGLTLQNATFTFTPAGCGTVTNTTGAASAAGDTNVRFTAATIAPGAACQVVVNVTDTASGTNTTNAPTAAGPVALAGTSVSAGLTVTPVAPTVIKSFASGAIASGGNTNLTVTIGNGNAGAITLTSAFTDTFPAGMTIGTPGNLAPSNACGGVTATSGTGSFSIANGTSIPAGGCAVVVNVTSSTGGPATNTITAGALQTVAGSNAAAASATLNIYEPPTVSKVFTPSSIPSGGTSTMTISVTNPAANPGTLTGVSIGDTYTGTLANSAAASPVTCSAGGSASLTGGTNGGTAVGFTAGTLAPGETCTITQGVTATSTNNNTTGAPAATGPVALTGTVASYTLTTTLLAPPTVTKSFSPTQIEVSPGQSTLKITLTNPAQNPIAITGVGFSDTFQAGLVVAGTVSNGCQGSATVLAGNTGISLSGGSIPANGSCTITVPVTSSTTGSYTNTIAAGAVTTTNAGSNTAPATTSPALTVSTVSAPFVTKSFSPNEVGISIASTVTIAIQNKNASVALTGVGFTDTLPGGMVVTTPSGIASSGCGTNATVVGNNLSISLSGGTIAAGSTCTISFNVTSTTTGQSGNTVTVSTTNAGSSSATGYLNVLQALTVSKTFSPKVIRPGETSTMTITVSNPNGIAVTGVGFSDTYPAGLFNSGSASASAGCIGASVASSNGAQYGSLVLSGVTVQGGVPCTVTVKVTSSATGPYTNTTGAISTDNAGTGSAATGVLTVGLPNITMLKTVQNYSDPVNGTANPRAIPGAMLQYTILVTNFGNGATDADSVIINDPIPQKTTLVVSGTPVGFTDGARASGLTFTWGGLGNAIDDVMFSTNGTDFSYTPSPGANGADPAVRYLRINPKGAFNGSDGTNNPSFSLTFKVIIN
jgi:uncharacterized repeat protein (TIGR01451 family)